MEDLNKGGKETEFFLVFSRVFFLGTLFKTHTHTYKRPHPHTHVCRHALTHTNTHTHTLTYIRIHTINQTQTHRHVGHLEVFFSPIVSPPSFSFNALVTQIYV